MLVCGIVLQAVKGPEFEAVKWREAPRAECRRWVFPARTASANLC